MSQNIRPTPDASGRHGSGANVLGSGWAIMSDSSIALKPVIDDPSKPIPPSKASSSSDAFIENALSCPRMSVNHIRMKRISRSLTSARTSSLLRGVLMARERYFLLRPPYAAPMRLLVTALAALAALLCACGSSSARSSAGAGPPCGPAGARTVAADAQARVYVKNGRVYGCSDRARRSYMLGATTCRPAGQMIAPVALAGRLVAYGSEQCGIDTGSA